MGLRGFIRHIFKSSTSWSLSWTCGCTVRIQLLLNSGFLRCLQNENEDEVNKLQASKRHLACVLSYQRWTLNVERLS